MSDESTQAFSNNESDNTEPASCTNTSCCPPQATPFKRPVAKIGRNDPCPCGNGRKYKKCCGKNS